MDAARRRAACLQLAESATLTFDMMGRASARESDCWRPTALQAAFGHQCASAVSSLRFLCAYWRALLRKTKSTRSWHAQNESLLLFMQSCSPLSRLLPPCSAYVDSSASAVYRLSIGWTPAALFQRLARWVSSVTRPSSSVVVHAGRMHALF